MDNKILNRAGVAAAILLVPGGFILGATLLARRYRQQAAEKAAGQGETAGPPAEDEGTSS